MSVLCLIRKEPRIVNGELINPGEVAMIPNSLALALEDKGLVTWASPEAHVKHAAERRAKRELAELQAELQAEEKATKKGKR